MQTDATSFATDGVLVLRGALDPAPLAAEVDRALHEGVTAAIGFVEGQSGSYVPMLCERTPVSVGLVDRFAGVAAALLGRPVLPVRAKGVVYARDTGWHVDSTEAVASIGFLAYLDPLRAGAGALHVRPGSHRRPDNAHEVVIETDPGDVIVLDERVAHASFGGRDRRQWRIDFVAAPTDAEEADVRAYYAALFPPHAQPPYDADCYPSYGGSWMGSDRPWIAAMLWLGVFELAAIHEAL